MEVHPIYFDIETSGLNPMYKKIVLIQLLNDVGELTLLKEWEIGEKEMIKSFYEYLNELPKFTPVVHYNGSAFDIPFILVRTRMLDMNDYWEEFRNNVWVDLIKFIDCRTIKFDNLAKHYGYEWKCEYKGEDIPEFYTDKRYDDICSHGVDDVEALKHICENSDTLDLLVWGNRQKEYRQLKRW